MKKTFNYKPTKSILFLSILLIVILIAFLIVTSIDMAKSTDLNVIRLVLTIVFSLILILIVITFFMSKYQITKDGLIIKISLSTYNIELNTITSVRFVKDANKICIVYFVDDKMKFLFIQINDKDFQTFIKSLRKENPSILYEDAA